MNVKIIDGYLIKLNQDDQTAIILKYLNSYKAINIPKSITFKSTEYSIIKIEEDAFRSSWNPKIITFYSNSQLKYISKYSFINSGLQKLVLPKSIEFIEEGWCKSLNCLYYLTVPPNAKHIKYINNSYLICNNVKKLNKNLNKNTKKLNDNDDQDLNEDVENVLIFVRRDIELATIPANIKRIGNSAFENCTKPKTVNFESNSQSESSAVFIEEIGNNAFAYCKNLENITKIPSSIKRIGRMSFAYCSKLKTLHLPNESKLKMISSDAFFHSSINELNIPNLNEYFEEGWCRDTSELTNINIDAKHSYFQYINNSLLIQHYTSQQYDYNSEYEKEFPYSLSLSPSSNKQQNEQSEPKEQNETNIESNTFTLQFARRDIETVIILSNIKRIS